MHMQVRFFFLRYDIHISESTAKNNLLNVIKHVCLHLVSFSDNKIGKYKSFWQLSFGN